MCVVVIFAPLMHGLVLLQCSTYIWAVVSELLGQTVLLLVLFPCFKDRLLAVIPFYKQTACSFLSNLKSFEYVSNLLNSLL